ncbi:Ubiquitin-conjugating enzyme E2 6 [Naganishia albida]|nr:Ubiquitin-conjugating enzyme E2 6 [Naganishia albida]
MATKIATKRLQKEYQAMQKSPPPFILARFEEKNILDWHFIIRGPPDSPYAGGEYHGLIMFPSEYPFKPPDIKLFTPSGRFETGIKICMSMTSYHPSTWNAAWSVSTILTGLLSFMLGDEITTGAVKTSVEEKKRLAHASHGFNVANKKFRDIFPEYATPEMKDLPDMGQPPKPAGTTQPTPADPAETDILDAPSTAENGQQPVISPSSAATAVVANTTGARQQQIRQQSWFARWRWVLAALAVIILGRISSF